MSRTGRDAGFSLVESLVAIALLGLSIVTILGAIGTAASTSGLQARQADADAALRSGAEFVKSVSYIACPDVASYDVSSATTAPGMSVAATVQFWNGSNFQANCPAQDHGFQKVVLRASAAQEAFERTLEVIKRRP